MSISAVAACTYTTPAITSQTASLLTPVVHLRVKIKEVLAEVLESSETEAAQTIRRLSEVIWQGMTATELLDSAQDLLPYTDFIAIKAWTYSHYPIMYTIWREQHKEHSEEVARPKWGTHA